MEDVKVFVLGVKVASAGISVHTAFFSDTGPLLRFIPRVAGQFRIPLNPRTLAEEQAEEAFFNSLPVVQLPPNFQVTFHAPPFVRTLPSSHLFIHWKSLPLSLKWGADMKGMNLGGIIIQNVWVASNGYIISATPLFAKTQLGKLACHIHALQHLQGYIVIIVLFGSPISRH